MRKPRKPELGLDIKAACQALVAKHPEFRHEIRELARLLGDLELIRTAMTLSRHQSASLVLVLEESLRQLHSGRPCDLCSEPGQHLRFIGVGPEAWEGGCVPIGVALVCSRHAALSRRAFRKKFLAKMAGRKPEEFTRYHDRPVFLGPRIGGLTGLPPRVTPRRCRDCRAHIWIKLDDEETLRPVDPKAEFLCFDCAGPLLEQGRLLAVPDFGRTS